MVVIDPEWLRTAMGSALVCFPRSPHQRNTNTIPNHDRQHPLSALDALLSALCSHLCALRSILSALESWLSALDFLLAGLRSLLSILCSLLFAL